MSHGCTGRLKRTGVLECRHRRLLIRWGINDERASEHHHKRTEDSNQIALGCACRVIYQGQPIGLIVADSPSLAERACELVMVEYGPEGQLGDPIVTLEDAIGKESFFEGPALLGGPAFGQRSVGDAKAALQAATHKITDAV